MAAGLCLKDKYQLVDIFSRCFDRNIDCFNNHQLSNNRSAIAKPCEIFTDRMSNE
jgi:hypothetical protein